jgi:FkbM family methyltransferase
MKSLLQKLTGESAWKYASWYRDQFGLLPSVGALCRSMSPGDLVKAPNLLSGQKVLMRPGTADQYVYRDIFIGNEYDIELGDPKVIVDAGAHIGLGSVVFATRFPQAKIISLEPEPANFKVLQENARLYPSIQPVCMGLWNKKTSLRIEDSDAETWSFRVIEDPSGSGIPAIDILSLMREYKLDHIDVLKIDIEGSEVEVFNVCEPWIHLVDTLIVELHDRFRPGCTAALDNAVEGFEYSRSVYGENVIIKGLRKPNG